MAEIATIAANAKIDRVVVDLNADGTQTRIAVLSRYWDGLTPYPHYWQGGFNPIASVDYTTETNKGISDLNGVAEGI